MSTPVLSKKQQKRALSGKKGPAKGLRNVLALPYEFSWPILKNDDSDGLKLLLETSMPAMKRTSPNIPWSKLHRMKKAERRIAKNEARLKLDIPQPDESVLKSVVMGVNGVTRLLEKDNASCVLLEANVDSTFFIKHIVVMADRKNISCVVVPFLKNVMLETIGISSAAVALKKIVAESEDHHFHELYKKVAELAADLPKNMSLKLDFKESDISSQSIEETVNICEKSSDKLVAKSNKPFTLSTDVYKYRNSQKERVFVPKSSTGSENVEKRSDDNFISVVGDSGSESESIIDEIHNNRNKKTRYVNIHEGDDKNSREISKHDKTQLHGDYISMAKPAILGISKINSLNLEIDKPNKKRPKNNKNFQYQSLKVKRLQGSSKRVKATKVPKRNKK